ncbi:hypothetical protein F4782DRAFT_201074 [Xylaria castorea]|nr:hypothetical protein F4782DRAFT_201074 [Xylaria castorea]
MITASIEKYPCTITAQISRAVPMIIVRTKCQHREPGCAVYQITAPNQHEYHDRHPRSSGIIIGKIIIGLLFIAYVASQYTAKWATGSLNVTSDRARHHLNGNTSQDIVPSFVFSPPCPQEWSLSPTEPPRQQASSRIEKFVLRLCGLAK